MLAHFSSKKIEKKISGTVATIKLHTPKEYKAESFHKTKNVFTIIAMKQVRLTLCLKISHDF